MSIYRISSNIDDYMFFTIDDLDIYEKMEEFDIDGFGEPLKFAWVAPAAEFIPSDSGSTTLPDITQWNDTDLIISIKARELLDSTFKGLGEFYPLAGKCSDYLLFNPVNRMGNEIIDLDMTKSAYFDDGSWDRLERLVFNEKADSISPALFTIEIDRGVNLYCTDSFKDDIGKSGLKGLTFEKIG